MICWVDIFPGWFDDNISEKVCLEMGLRTTLADHWIDSQYIASLILPTNFDLVKWAQRDKIHILHFQPPSEPEYNRTIIHPDLFIRIARRSLQKLIKDPDKNQHKYVFIYGNTTIH